MHLDVLFLKSTTITLLFLIPIVGMVYDSISDMALTTLLCLDILHDLLSFGYKGKTPLAISFTLNIKTLPMHLKNSHLERTGYLFIAPFVSPLLWSGLYYTLCHWACLRTRYALENIFHLYFQCFTKCTQTIWRTLFSLSSTCIP